MNCFDRLSKSKNKDSKPASNPPEEYKQPGMQPQKYYHVDDQANNNNSEGGFFLGDTITYGNQPVQPILPNIGGYNAQLNQPQNTQWNRQQNTQGNWQQQPQISTWQTQLQNNRGLQGQQQNWGQQPGQQPSEQMNQNYSPQIQKNILTGLQNVIFQPGFIQDKTRPGQGQTQYVEQIGKSIFSQFQKKQELGGDTNHAIQYKSASNVIWQQAFKTIPRNINNSYQNLSQMGNNNIKKDNKILEEIDSIFPSPFIKYKIIPLNDEKKALDIVSTNDRLRGLVKNNVTIWDYHGGPNQLFHMAMHQFEKNSYYIFNIARGFVVQIPVDKPKNYKENQLQPVVARPRSGTPSNPNLRQLWKLQQSNFGSYVIRSAFDGRVLDLYHCRSDNGTPVISWTCTGQAANNQKWRIVPS